MHGIHTIATDWLSTSSMIDSKLSHLICKVSGLSSGPNFRLGTGSRGIEITRDSPGRDNKGYFKHGTVQDGIELLGIERDNLDGIEISRDARDGIEMPRDCSERD